MLYVSDVIHLVQAHNLSIHIYADDVQIYGSCDQTETSVLSSRMSSCLDDVISWFSSHRLLLNEEKTQFLWCSSKQRRSYIPDEPIRVGSSLVVPSRSVCCLGVHLDNHLSFTVHISRLVSSSFAILRQIRSIRRSLNRSLLVSIVSSLVISKIDYCISLLYGLPNVQQKRLQSVLNACARIIFFSSRFSSVSPMLQALKFLPIKNMIDYRIAVVTHNCLHNRAPEYLTENIQSCSKVVSLSRLRSSSSSRVMQPSSRRATLGGRAFPSAAAYTWNKLPSDISSLTNISIFKKKLKIHLLQSHSTIT